MVRVKSDIIFLIKKYTCTQHYTVLLLGTLQRLTLYTLLVWLKHLLFVLLLVLLGLL